MTDRRYSAVLSEAEQKQFVPLMRDLVTLAGACIRPYFLAGTTVEVKGDNTPVTAADRAAEAALREAIGARFAQHGILGEEGGESAAHGDFPRYRWVIDPIDGTRAFITNCFLFGSLIALERDEGQGWRPILGSISHPTAGVALIGHRGETRLYQQDGSGRAVRVRACAAIEEATVLASSYWGSAEQVAPNVQRIEQLARRAKLYRTWGDAFGYFALATGGADVMVDPVLSYWDVAALVPVIEGAGGVVTSWSGGDPLAEPSMIATAGPLQGEVLAVLSG